MPTYEMPLLLRLGNKAEYTHILKAVAKSIFETGGFIRKIENWGNKELPYKVNIDGKSHTQAGHFMLCFDVPPSQMIKIRDDCKRNISILRAEVYLQNVPDEKVRQCTLEEELLPPAYRPDIQKLIEASKKNKHKKKFQYNSGLDYYPFL